MTDIFGSIIAIAVSVAVILIFRQIDKNNRSLEKVKKYTDKIKNDLDVYFNEQKEKLDNAAVNLKVEQQKAVATISRLNEQYDEFNNKATTLSEHSSAVDTINNRISAYDSSLKELMEMTARIEENLESLHKESSFVSGLSKKIEVQRDKLDSVEKKIPSLQQEFDKLNKERLDSVSNEVIGRFEDKATQLESSFTERASELDNSFTTRSESVVSTFKEKVSELESETSEAVKKSAELLDEINKSIIQAYSEAADKADKLESDVFITLNQKAQQREDSFAAKAESRLNQLSESLSAQLSVFEESIGNAQSKYDEVVQQVDDKCTEYEQEARSVAARFENELANTQGILTELKNEVEQKTGEINVRLNEVLTQAANDSLELGQKTSDTFNKKFTQHFEELESDLTEKLQTGLANSNAAINDGLTETSQLIEAGISETKNLFEQELTKTKQLLEQELLNTNQIATGGMASLNSEITNAMSELHDNISIDLQKVKLFAETGYNEWQKKSEEIANKYTTENEKLQETYTVSYADILNKFTALETNVKETTSKIEEQTVSNNTKLTEIESVVEQKTSDIINRMDNAYEMATTRVTELESGAYKQFTEQSESRQAQNKADYDAQLETLKKSIQESFDNVRDKLLSDTESTKALAEQYKKEWSEQASQLLDSFNSEINKNTQVYNQTVKEMDDRFSAYDVATKNQADKISESIISNGDTLTELKKSFTEELTSVSTKLESALTEALTNHDNASTAFFAEMEAQLDTYKEAMAYRYERLDNASGELDNLEKNFRKAMNETEERVNLDFQTFIRNQQTTQNDFEKTIQGHSDEISKHIQSLEGELNELKKRAYDNVSEKLKVFEDDFAADLLKRGNAIEESFTDWKASFDNRLDNTATEAESARKALESQYNEDLKKGLTALQERSHEQTSRFEELLNLANVSIQSRFDNCDTTLKSFIEQYHTDLNNAKSTADLYLKKELENESDAIDRELSKFERDITSRLEVLNSQVSETNDTTDGVVKGIMADFSSWQERVNQQFEETKTMFSSKLSALEQSSGELITQVQNTFETDVNGFRTKSEEERNLLSTQLEQVKEASAKSITDYENRSSSMIDSFKKAYNDMVEDSQKRLRDQNTDAEQKLRALRALVQEIREKNEESQEKMVLKMQGDANKLNTTMDDIDDRLNQFIAQTRVFDKAEELKTNLENQIASLQTEIAKIETFHEEAANIEQQFARINKMEDELSQKLQHFNDEKKHLDELENDFKKLVTLSDSMDTKILELQTTNDDVQNMQAQIRNMMKIVTDSSAKFERLEKKLPVLDQTAADVDQSFENLKQLENRLDACATLTEQFPNQLSDVKNDVERLMNNTARVSDVVAKLESLDSVLGDTENRIKEVEKSRDWIARTETRLQEISDKAEKEVKLIGELVKTPQDRQRDNKGAPPESTRENVIKLLHGGWKPEEIAKRLNLSLGEVELIQDFYDRGNVQ